MIDEGKRNDASILRDRRPRYRGRGIAPPPVGRDDGRMNDHIVVVVFVIIRSSVSSSFGRPHLHLLSGSTFDYRETRTTAKWTMASQLRIHVVLLLICDPLLPIFFILLGRRI